MVHFNKKSDCGQAHGVIASAISPIRLSISPHGVFLVLYDVLSSINPKTGAPFGPPVHLLILNLSFYSSAGTEESVFHRQKIQNCSVASEPSVSG